LSIIQIRNRNEIQVRIIPGANAQSADDLITAGESVARCRPHEQVNYIFIAPIK
jgi:hypothetical protein